MDYWPKMVVPYVIRRAQASDAPALTDLAFNAKRLWGYSDAQMEHWRAELRISEDYVAHSHAYLLEAPLSSTPANAPQVAGFYVLAACSGRMTLAHLWVLPASARRGYGSALLAHATATARGSGAADIHIDADPNAELFYLRHGAVRAGTMAAPVEGDPHRVRPQLVLPLR